MSKSVFEPKRLVLITALLLTGCGGGGVPSTDSASEEASNMHQELKIVNPADDGATNVNSGQVSAMAVTIGSIYLEQQLPPLTVTGTILQATDVAVNSTDAYITYSSVDTGGTIIKKGAVQHVTSLKCDNILTTRVEYCLGTGTSLDFPTTDLFAAYSDGTNLFVAGSTLNEDFAPKYGRLYKVSLDASKNPSAVTVTQTLESYAGTGITKVGTNLLVTSGTSATLAIRGGLTVVDAATLTQSGFQSIYDARAVAVDPNNALQSYVVRGAIDGSTPGAVLQFASSGASVSSRTVATGGNNIAESKSSILVGQYTILTSMGDQGFKLSCKATGASLATVPAPIVTGISPSLTVTNSVAAMPGYILAANGEAGVYIYTFVKNTLGGTPCDGVTLTLLGRISLNSSGTYVNGALSANSVKYLPVFDLLGVLTSKLVVIASGNKGTSLLNMSGLTVGLTDVNDF